MAAPRVIPPGLPQSLVYPDVSVGSIAAGAAARFGDRTAFRHNDQFVTYREVWNRACKFANALIDASIGTGDTVAIHLPNCLAYPIAYYGTALAGATFSPINPLSPRPELVAALVDGAATAVVTSGKTAHILADAIDETNVRLTIVSCPDDELGNNQVEFETFSQGQKETRPSVALDPHIDLAHLAYTGGTTGRSKGVRLPHRSVITNVLQFACWNSGSIPTVDAEGDVRLDQVGDESEWPIRLGTGSGINLTPWFHAMGTIGGLNIPMLTGSTVTLHSRFDPIVYLADAERLEVTSIAGAPALFGALMSCPNVSTRDLSHVRSITSGAAPLPETIINRLHKRFPNAVVIEAYGLTEVTMGATSAPAFRSGIRKVRSVGVPVFDTEVKIIALHDGKELPPNAEGEICIRGPQVMAGYHNQETETSRVLIDGWLHTGDIGTLDEEGYLSIIDRQKDMLIYKGYNVYPRELEELLNADHGVAAAAVVGKPDPTVGELPVAFVVRAQDNGYPKAQDLLDKVNEHVLPYKRLREIHFVTEIPISAAGKILKRQLRDTLGTARQSG